MNLKTKFGLMTMCSVCCALLYEDIFARDNKSQNARQSSVSSLIKDIKETQQVSADQGQKRYELASQWFEAAEKGDIETMKSLHEDVFSGNSINRKDDDGRTALEIAVQNGHSAVVEWLLEYINAENVPFNINSRTAKHNSLLAIATENGHKSVVRILLEHRANPNAFDLSAKGRGRSALMIAAYKGYTEIVELLLNSNDDPKLYRGADTSEQDYDGKTALMMAVEQNHLDIVKLLLNHGAKIKINIQDYDGKTALIMAVEQNHSDIVKLLLSHGDKIEIKIKDKNGKRALDYAEGNAELTKLLTEFLENKKKKGNKNVFKKVWSKVTGKNNQKNRRLSTDSNATFVENDAQTERNAHDVESSTDTLIGK